MTIARIDLPDAVYQRAWSVADAAERATLLSTVLGPKRGDIILQLDTGIFYFVVQTGIAQPISGLAGVNSGIWTPIDTSGDGLTLSYAGGAYTEVGGVYFIVGQVVYPATASPTLSQLGGLPATVAGGNSALQVQSAGAAVDFTMWTYYGTTNFRASIVGTGLQPTNAEMSNSNTIFSGFFLT